mgnify:CR=1 FL=1
MPAGIMQLGTSSSARGIGTKCSTVGERQVSSLLTRMHRESGGAKRTEEETEPPSIFHICSLGCPRGEHPWLGSSMPNDRGRKLHSIESLEARLSEVAQGRAETEINK